MNNKEIVRVVRDGDIDTLKSFLQDGGDPNTVDTMRHGESLLSSVAATGGNIEMATLLINLGADVNHQDFRGDTPLHWGQFNESFCRLLIENGADIHLKNELGKLPQDDNQYTQNRVVLSDLKVEIESKRLESAITKVGPVLPSVPRKRMGGKDRDR